MEEYEVSSSLHQQVVEINKTLETQELQEMKNVGNQESKGYIEDFFHSIIFLQHHSILQQFLAPSFQGNLVAPTIVFISYMFVIWVCI